MAYGVVTLVKSHKAQSVQRHRQQLNTSDSNTKLRTRNYYSQQKSINPLGNM